MCSAVAHPVADLTDRSDVEALLRRFYGRVFDDDVLAGPFAELRATGLESHLPVMCDFWETVLFRAGLYRGSALVVHRRLDERHRLEADHFARWVALWHRTVDEMYAGPAAERAKIQGTRIAGAMLRRLRGAESGTFATSPGPADRPTLVAHP
jgi:hemoglobin